MFNAWLHPCPAACLACSFLIYPPTRAQGAARPGGLWGGFPDPAKPICMGFAKNRLASSHAAEMAGRAPAAYARRPHARGRASAPPWERGAAPQPAYPAPQVAYPAPQVAYPAPSYALSSTSFFSNLLNIYYLFLSSLLTY